MWSVILIIGGIAGVIVSLAIAFEYERAIVFCGTVISVVVIVVGISMAVKDASIINSYICEEENKIQAFEVNIKREIFIVGNKSRYLTVLKKLNTLSPKELKILRVEDIEIVAGNNWKVLPNKIEVDHKGSPQEIKNYILNNLSEARKKGELEAQLKKQVKEYRGMLASVKTDKKYIKDFMKNQDLYMLQGEVLVVNGPFISPPYTSYSKRLAKVEIREPGHGVIVLEGDESIWVGDTLVIRYVKGKLFVDKLQEVRGKVITVKLFPTLIKYWTSSTYAHTVVGLETSDGHLVSFDFLGLHPEFEIESFCLVRYVENNYSDWKKTYSSWLSPGWLFVKHELVEVKKIK